MEEKTKTEKTDSKMQDHTAMNTQKESQHMMKVKWRWVYVDTNNFTSRFLVLSLAFSSLFTKGPHK